MKAYRLPELRKTEQYLRLLGYSERSIRDITAASRREIVRTGILRHFFDDGAHRRSGNGGGGAYDML